MKNARNQVQLIGRLGKEVETLKTSSGKTRATLSIAVNNYYTNAIGQKIENTYWFRVIAWNHTAERMAQYLSKGDEIMIQGRLEARSYEDKNGKTQYITEVVTDQYIQMKAPKAKAMA